MIEFLRLKNGKAGYWRELAERDGARHFGERFVSQSFDGFCREPAPVLRRIYERMGLELPRLESSRMDLGTSPSPGCRFSSVLTPKKIGPGGRPPGSRAFDVSLGQRRSKRSRFMTLSQAATKSCTNFSLASCEA